MKRCLIVYPYGFIEENDIDKLIYGFKASGIECFPLPTRWRLLFRVYDLDKLPNIDAEELSDILEAMTKK